MIGSLYGKVELRDAPYILVNVQGVGYRVLVSSGTLGKAKQDSDIKLYTYAYIREDALDLFGFEQIQDLKLFERLLSVSGIGPKTAMNVFSIGPRSSIIDAIIKGDVSFFTSVPRLGKKNAQKIIIELRGKFEGVGELDLTSQDEDEDVIDALKHFGFTPQEARLSLQNIEIDGKTLEEKVKLALRSVKK
ncbi:Holliday junction branch migration protein RuvA [Candidatus Levyibacteriota bacterium]|nr:Holliday junction branch migration protein RuvA [Candidatus Levybacteria bacterium]MSU26154.1 Holliday junction branch migration protein RuvA [Candidatus Levybacteria bacterium]GDX62231.1 Holliday junction branch migration protein RuvA [Candidatus Levybacteria bacterium]